MGRIGSKPKESEVKVPEQSQRGNLLTVRQFALKNQGRWPGSESAIRAIIFDAAWGKNHFQEAFKRVGRRVLVDEKAFWDAVNGSQEPNNG